jgi:hypothetical protein
MGCSRRARRAVHPGRRACSISAAGESLQRFLPRGCSYRGCDLVARDARTIVAISMPVSSRPRAAEVDIITMLGVLEYITDVEGFLTQLRSGKRDVVLSYCATDLTGSVDRASLGWLNHFSLEDLAALFDRHDFVIKGTMPVDSCRS